MRRRLTAVPFTLGQGAGLFRVCPFLQKLYRVASGCVLAGRAVLPSPRQGASVEPTGRHLPHTAPPADGPQMAMPMDEGVLQRGSFLKSLPHPASLWNLFHHDHTGERRAGVEGKRPFRQFAVFGKCQRIIKDFLCRNVARLAAGLYFLREQLSNHELMRQSKYAAMSHC